MSTADGDRGKVGEHQSQEALLYGNDTSEISSVCSVGLPDWKQKWITVFQFESVPVQPLAGYKHEFYELDFLKKHTAASFHSGHFELLLF